MFSPVACSQCGKPFQVPEATLGKPSVCPWCQATVLALPVGTQATTPVPPTPEPLSLDEAPAPSAPRSPRNRLFWFLAGFVGLFALVIATTATIGVKRYKQGHGAGWEWQAFSAPDKSFSVDMLGRPVEDADAGAGQKRHSAEGWYSGTVTWVGWRDLTENEVNQAHDKKDGWVHLRPLFDGELDRLKTKYGGKVIKEATKDFDARLTREVWLTSDDVGVAERMIVVPNGPRPRMYFVGMAGKINFDGPEVQRLFDSFRVAE